MRLTRETLLRIAKETALKRALSDRALVAAYLTGSLLTEDPFLGGATDIDLIFVHPGEPKVRREIVAVTPEVHLDIQHNPRRVYDRPRDLRVHPWLGPELYDPLPLHVTQHFFEYVQAGVRDKYHEPASVLARARSHAEHARQIWSGLREGEETGPSQLLVYLEAVNLAANAVAVLSGVPLAERRLLLQFPARAEAAGHPGLSAGLLGLLGAPRAGTTDLRGFLPAWEKAFAAAAGRPGVDARIHAARLIYYKMAFLFLLESPLPQAVLWPLLLTWTLSAAVLPPTKAAKWMEACEALGLAGDGLQERVEGLDHFLDQIEDLLDGMAANQGL